MMKRLIYILLLFFAAFCAEAATLTSKSGKQQMRTIRENLKNQKGAEALKVVESMIKDSLYTWNAQVLQYGTEASRILYNNENEKFYLKSKPDTAALFSTLYNIYRFALLTDQAEVKERKGGKYHFRKSNMDFMTRNFRNLTAAPRYFSAKGKWDEVQKFTAIILDIDKAPMMSTLSPSLLDEKAQSDFACMNVSACYRLKKYAEIGNYADLAVVANANKETALEQLAYAEVQMQDSVHYIMHLKEGHKSFPANMFFFSRIIDYYLQTGNNESVLTTSDETLEYVLAKAQEVAAFCVIDKVSSYGRPSEADALYGVRETVALPQEQIAQIFEARAIAYHNQHNREACIDEAKNILTWNAEHTRANFYIGASYYSLAEDIVIPARVDDPDYPRAMERRKALLSQARPYLEEYRRQNPNDQERWAPLLYEVYLNLNLGAEFEEVSKYVP